mmetsp:Transcript_16448/g.47238  ORF Transcript_16448/g.47238 Transcript_16448/m.47238 type:complete len:226 (-) Transcript_16448:353-1030(-)
MIHGPSTAAGNVNVTREAHRGISHVGTSMLRRSGGGKQPTLTLKGTTIPSPTHPIEGPHHPHNVQEGEEVGNDGGVGQAGHHLARRLVQRTDVVGLGGQQGAVEKDDVHPAVTGTGRQARGPVVELQTELGRFRRRRLVLRVVIARIIRIAFGAAHPPPPPPGRRRLGPRPLLGPFVPPDAPLDAVLDLVVQPDKSRPGNELRRATSERWVVRTKGWGESERKYG